MTSRAAFVLPAIAALALSACQHQPAKLSVADREAIQAVSDAFLQHVKARDWAALGQLFTEDAVVMPPNQQAVVGRKAIQDFNAASPPAAEFTLSNDEIDGVGDFAYVRGRYLIRPAAAGEPADSGKYIEIRRKQPDGTWKFAADIFNSSVPLPAPVRK